MSTVPLRKTIISIGKECSTRWRNFIHFSFKQLAGTQYPHVHWWSSSRVLQICLTGTDDLPHGYWISLRALRILTGTEDRQFVQVDKFWHTFVNCLGILSDFCHFQRTDNVFNGWIDHLLFPDGRIPLPGNYVKFARHWLLFIGKIRKWYMAENEHFVT